MRNAGLALLPSCNFSAIVLACLLVIASPLLAQRPPLLITQPIDNSVRTVLTGNIHPLARAQYDQGEAPSDLVLHRMMLVLKRSPQQEASLQHVIPSSHRYVRSFFDMPSSPGEGCTNRDSY